MRNKILTAALLLALPASAHVSLTQNSAAPGANFVAHFRVGHGCSGSPTTGLRIALPDSISAAEGQEAAGWSLAVEKINGRVSAITWKGGTLDAKTPGEFAIAMTLPDRPVTLVFPATQTCAVGVEEWSDAPITGQKSAHPAPTLYVGIDAPKKDGMAPGMVMPDGSHM